MIYYGKQTIGKEEIAAVEKVLKSNRITQGHVIQEFEENIAEYCGAKYAVACSNGTAALHIAIQAAEIPDNSQGITSPITFLATANSMLYNKIKPNFVDIKQETPIIDPVLIKKQINPKTRLITTVDYAGIPCDYTEIQQIANEKKITLIADAAHSLGAEYKGKKSGTLADMTIFSFHPVKSITTGEGGMVLTNDQNLYELLKSLRTHGISKKNTQAKNELGNPWHYEMHHLGFNYRITDIQCAIGIEQLKKLPRFIEKRTEIAQYYYQKLSSIDSISTIPIPEDRKSAFHLFPVVIDFDQLSLTKKQLFEELKKLNIILQVHYIPIQKQPYYQALGFSTKETPNAENFYHNVVSLPIYPDLSRQEQDYVINHLTKTLKRK